MPLEGVMLSAGIASPNAPTVCFDFGGAGALRNDVVGSGYAVTVSDGTHEMDLEGQRLIWRHGTDLAVHTLTLRRVPIGVCGTCMAARVMTDARAVLVRR